MLIAPVSCKTSSAAMVSDRIRESARIAGLDRRNKDQVSSCVPNEISSGIFLDK